LYCTNSTGGYKCDSDDGSNISVVNCPADLKMKNSLKNKFGDALDATASDENDSWDINGEVEKAIRDCKSWSQVSNNIDNAQGIYCYIRDFNSNIPGNISTFKCDSNQDSTFIYGNCPADLESHRQTSDESAAQTPAPVSEATTTSAPVTTDEWASFNQEMKELKQQIQDCKEWTPMESNNITDGGLYCNDKDDKMFKCKENPLKGNDISSGNCPGNDKADETGDDADKMWFWY